MKWFTYFIAPAISVPTSFFVVLNDIHIHKYFDSTAEKLRWFCNNVVSSLDREQIKFIVLNGDLTDSSTEPWSAENPGQRETEWSKLWDSVRDCLKYEIPFYAVRGNHDAFGVLRYGHTTNAFYRDFFARLNEATGLSIHNQYLGSYSVMHIDTRKIKLIFLDSSQEIIGRHFHAKFDTQDALWLNSELDEMLEGNSTYIFSHFPTGSYLPGHRERLLSILDNHHDKIVSFHAGHVHSIFGHRAQVTHASGVKEFEVVDFASHGVFRVVPFMSSEVALSVDLSIASMSLPFGGATIDPLNGRTIAVVFGDAKLVGCNNHLKLGKNERDYKIFFTDLPCDSLSLLRPDGTSVPLEVSYSEDMTGFTRWAFLNVYETGILICLIGYLIMCVVLYWYYYRSSGFIDRLVVFLGLICPIMPWAIGKGFSDRLCISGIWGHIDLQTWNWMPMDLVTIHIVALELRTIIKIAVLSLQPGTPIHFLASIVLVSSTVLGVKMLTLTYGPWAYLSPVIIWEFTCWTCKVSRYVTGKTISF